MMLTILRAGGCLGEKEQTVAMLVTGSGCWPWKQSVFLNTAVQKSFHL